jgi:hypothetical protein
MRSQTQKQEEQLLRRSSRELYGLLGALGERMYLEAMSLCDSEKEAAAWASANLVRSLEEHRLLGRVALVP